MMLEGFSSLSGNKGLCGVPSLPACPLFWDKGGLNETGKIAIGVSCGVVLIVVLLVIYIVCIRRGPNDYDFDFPQDFTSIAAKRNRYHRQKSLMLLEMETQNSNGLQTAVAHDIPMKQTYPPQTPPQKAVKDLEQQEAEWSDAERSDAEACEAMFV
uniref:Uncharacterized protein n=1 Tax=Ananas comosus var. bracteatus TaxID=296719 RepID=A0A6V7QH21_ANACO|nr:unnamed protein product [Ananas comosus var. bracteatus]